MREIKANFSITGEYVVNLMAEDHEAPNKESVNRKIVMQKIDRKLKKKVLKLLIFKWLSELERKILMNILLLHL